MKYNIYDICSEELSGINSRELSAVKLWIYDTKQNI